MMSNYRRMMYHARPDEAIAEIELLEAEAEKLRAELAAAQEQYAIANQERNQLIGNLAETQNDLRLWQETCEIREQGARAREGWLKHLLEAAQPHIDSLLCPSVWRTADGPPPHNELCTAMRAAAARPTQESFQDAVRNDPDMTPEQKAKWLGAAGRK